MRRLDGHDEEDARDGGEGRERGGLEQIEPRAAVGVEVEQSDDLTCDGRADVRAEDDADGLVSVSTPAPTRPEVSTMVAVEL